MTTNNSLTLKRFRFFVGIALLWDLTLRILDWDLLFVELGSCHHPMLSLARLFHYLSLSEGIAKLLTAMLGVLYLFFLTDKATKLATIVIPAVFFALSTSSPHINSMQDFVMFFFLLFHALLYFSQWDKKIFDTLVIVPFVLIYFSSGASKFIHPFWQTGEALKNILSVPYVGWGMTPFLLILPSFLLKILNHAAIITELSIAIFLCIPNSKARRVAVLLAIGLHIGIAATMNVGMFSVFMLANISLLWDISLKEPLTTQETQKKHQTSTTFFRAASVMLCIFIICSALDFLSKGSLSLNKKVITLFQKAEFKWQPFWFNMYTQNDLISGQKRIGIATVKNHNGTEFTTEKYLVDSLLHKGERVQAASFLESSSRNKFLCIRGNKSSYIERKSSASLGGKVELLDKVIHQREFLGGSEELVGIDWVGCG